MTVQELIDYLNKIKDKNMKVYLVNNDKGISRFNCFRLWGGVDLIIIKNGVYKKENEVTCSECGCVFRYFNSDIITETSDLYEQELLRWIWNT